MKTGIEFTDGERHVSAGVTNGFPDWSVLPHRAPQEEVSLRLTRRGEAIRIQVELEGRWQMVRLAYLKPAEALQVGVLCCSPEREGFVVEFRDFRVEPPIDRALYT